MPAIASEILAIAQNTRCNVFVESGTFKGKSLRTAIESGIFEKHYSVEIQPSLYEDLKPKFAERQNCQIFLGNSSTVFVENIFPLCAAGDRLFFWLDGHFSKGETGGAESPCPLLDELAAIRQHCPTQSLVIAIDDTDDFGRTDPDVPGLNWQTRSEIEAAALKINPSFHILDYTSNNPDKKLARGVLVFSALRIDE